MKPLAEIQRMDDLPARHRRFVQYIMEGLGPSEAARRAGFAERYGSTLAKKLQHIITREQAGIRRELHKLIESKAEHALRTLGELLDGESEAVRFRSAAFIWEQAVGKAKGVREVKHQFSGTVSVMLQQAQEELSEWRKQYIDVEAEKPVLRPVKAGPRGASDENPD